MNKILPDLLHGADYNYEQWLDYPEILDDDFRLMKIANCNVMTIGIFSWAKLEITEGVFNFTWLDNLLDRLQKNNMKAILSTPSGSKPVWMSIEYPEVCRVDKNRKREPHGLRHNHCRTSPVYREKCININTLLAERYKKHPALIMWHVSNEYNSGECYCDLCLDGFREWLKNRYGSLDNLNKAWWTTFWSHTYTEWGQIDPSDPSVHGLMLDWQRFTSDQTLDFFKTESEPLRQLTPHIPITTNFMIPDVGLDYWAFAPYISMISWDSYPEWHKYENEWEEGVRTSFFHDLYRSMKDQSFMMMESSPNVTNWQGISIPKKKNMHLLSSLQAVAHGSDTVQYFQWRQSRGGEEKFHGSVVSHTGHENTKVFKDVAGVGEMLKKLNGVCGSVTKAEVAIIYDFQSEWAINHAQLPRNFEKNYRDTCISHYKSFWNMGIAADIKDCSCTDFSKYKIVIAPMLYMVRNGFEKNIERFVDNGGTFVSTYLSGVVNESDLCFLGGSPGPLSKLLGIWIEDLGVLNENNRQKIELENSQFEALHFADHIHLTRAEILSKFSCGDFNGLPGVTQNSYGKGKALYLGARFEDSFHDLFYRKLAVNCNISLKTELPLPAGVTIQYRESENTKYAFIMNFTPNVVNISLTEKNWVYLENDVSFDKNIELEAYGLKIIIKC